MKSTEILIDLNLQDPQCTMISPGYRHPRIEWNPDNLVKLETMISQCMKTRQQQELLENLEKKIPICYVDCSQKGEDDIMFFILREYLKQSKAENKEHSIVKVIGDHSIVTTSKEDWQNHIKKNTPDLESILTQYSKLLKGVLAKSDKHMDIFNFECDVTFNGLAELMKQEDQKYLYLYLDNIAVLNREEQQRINTFLYTRGRIPRDRWIRVKINNGHGHRKTRSSSVGQRVDATHDYSEVNIYEDAL